MAKILLIDDDEPFRKILQQTLTIAGHAVALAGDGAEGVRLFRADPADLVITDIFMPNQEGLETIMHLRRENPSLGIIAMSGNTGTQPDWLQIAERLGARRILAKPFTKDVLMQAVTEVLPSGSVPPEAGPKRDA